MRDPLNQVGLGACLWELSRLMYEEPVLCGQHHSLGLVSSCMKVEKAH